MGVQKLSVVQIIRSISVEFHRFVRDGVQTFNVYAVGDIIFYKENKTQKITRGIVIIENCVVWQGTVAAYCSVYLYIHLL